MSKYTAEDFAQADLATRGDYGVARRADPTETDPWHIYGDGQGWFSDEEMAADGWVPVVEATEAHPDQVERLSKRLAAAGDQIESQRLALEDLREENYRLERILQTPLSLKDLQVAWEEAEQADKCRKGDLLILRNDHGGYEVYQAEGDGRLLFSRILSRAPQREPWADLADALRGTVWERLSGDVDGLAAAVHAAGWRKGGDES